MRQRSNATETSIWLGQENGEREAFGGGKLWIGKHAVDNDVLVFDPAEGDASADPLHLYSLTQHRMRAFPRATVLQRIHPLEDEVSEARARKEYAEREGLRAAHEEALVAARADRLVRQQDHVVEAHRARMETAGRDYQGVQPTPSNHSPGRRTKCHACGIPLDDFSGYVCNACRGVLCSCGACGCGKS